MASKVLGISFILTTLIANTHQAIHFATELGSIKQSIVGQYDFSEAEIEAIENEAIERVIRSLDWFHPEVM